MPLTSIQTDILLLLASHRHPESYVAGATPLNRNGLRYSGDIDIFHDREDMVTSAALADVEMLKMSGYQIRWLRQLPLIQTAEITRDGQQTRLEWVVDSDFRFFPTIRGRGTGVMVNPL